MSDRGDPEGAGVATEKTSMSSKVERPILLEHGAGSLSSVPWGLYSRISSPWLLSIVDQGSKGFSA